MISRHRITSSYVELFWTTWQPFLPGKLNLLRAPRKDSLQTGFAKPEWSPHLPRSLRSFFRFALAEFFSHLARSFAVFVGYEKKKKQTIHSRWIMHRRGKTYKATLQHILSSSRVILSCKPLRIPSSFEVITHLYELCVWMKDSRSKSK